MSAWLEEESTRIQKYRNAQFKDNYCRVEKLTCVMKISQNHVRTRDVSQSENRSYKKGSMPVVSTLLLKDDCQKLKKDKPVQRTHENKYNTEYIQIIIHVIYCRPRPMMFCMSLALQTSTKTRLWNCVSGCPISVKYSVWKSSQKL